MVRNRNLTGGRDPQLVRVLVPIITKEDCFSPGGGELGWSIGFLNVDHGAAAKRDQVREIGRGSVPQFVRRLELDGAVWRSVLQVDRGGDSFASPG
jgi:hypothetical protein